MSAADFDLQKGLNEWREEQMVKEGLGDDTFFGPQIILSDETMQTIIDYAHHHALPDTQSLQDHIDWTYASEYATAIIALVKKYLPEPVPIVQSEPTGSQSTTVPQTSRTTQALLEGDSSNAPRVRKKVQCSACQAFGHIGKL